jgi:hypothetical protein
VKLDVIVAHLIYRHLSMIRTISLGRIDGSDNIVVDGAAFTAESSDGVRYLAPAHNIMIRDITPLIYIPPP